MVGNSLISCACALWSWQVLLQADTIRQLDRASKDLTAAEEQRAEARRSAEQEASERQRAVLALEGQLADAQAAKAVAEAKAEELERQVRNGGIETGEEGGERDR